MKEKVKHTLFIILFIGIFFAARGVEMYQQWQYKKTLSSLRTLSPQEVTMFKIYPRVIIPVGKPVEFSGDDPIIGEFFQALTDLRTYHPSHDQVFSEDNSWFLEISTESTMIQIDFHIPSPHRNFVAGEFGRFGERRSTFYGSFQSQNLFQWYQKYSHRWLKPEASRPTPTPQPDPPDSE